MLEAATATVLLEQAAQIHDRLAARAHHVDPADFDSILSLVAAVVIHGLFEESVGFDSNEYFAPEVRESLAREHAELSDALALMEDLAENNPESADLRALSGAILVTARRHVDRDQRTIYGSLARLSAVSRAEDPK